MSASPAEMIRAALVAKGVGVLPSSATPPQAPVWPVFVGALPDAPDNSICVYDTQGKYDGRIMKTGETIRHPGFQCRVRATDHPTGYAMIRVIQETLDGLLNFEVAIGTTNYTIQSIMQNEGILSLGQEPDVKRRNGFTINGTITFKEELP